MQNKDQNFCIYLVSLNNCLNYVCLNYVKRKYIANFISKQLVGERSICTECEKSTLNLIMVLRVFAFLFHLRSSGFSVRSSFNTHRLPKSPEESHFRVRPIWPILGR